MRLFFSLSVLVWVCLGIAQTNITRPGIYSYTVPKGYRQQRSDRVDFLFSRVAAGNLSVLMVNTTKTQDKTNKEMLDRIVADLKDQDPGAPHITIRSTDTIKVGGKQAISMLLSSTKNNTLVYQRQIVVLHKGHKVLFLNSYAENYKAQDKEFLASLSGVRLL